MSRRVDAGVGHSGQHLHGAPAEAQRDRPGPAGLVSPNGGAGGGRSRAGDRSMWAGQQPQREGGLTWDDAVADYPQGGGARPTQPGDPAGRQAP